ncbi:hypothetical protein [Arthrobacter tecti]
MRIEELALELIGVDTQFLLQSGVPDASWRLPDQDAVDVDHQHRWHAHHPISRN